MKQILFSLSLIIFIASCKSGLTEEEKNTVINNIENGTSKFIEIQDIQQIGKEKKGSVYSYKKFSIKIKVIKSCAANLITRTAVPDIRTCLVEDKYKFENKSNLILEDYNAGDTLMLNGILFSSISKEITFADLSKCLFYLKEDVSAYTGNKNELCSDIKYCYNMGINLAKGFSDKDFELLENSNKKLRDNADIIGSIYLGSEIMNKVKFYRQLQESKIDSITYYKNIWNTSLVRYFYIELPQVNCDFN